MLSSCQVSIIQVCVDIFVGALAYADDLVLTAPSANALRKMLTICDAYASDYFMNFNAQKSKCMIVLPRSRRLLVPLLSAVSYTHLTLPTIYSV